MYSRTIKNLLSAAKEALDELEPTTSDKPGYYSDPMQVARLRATIREAEKEINQPCECHYCLGGKIQ